MAIEAQKEIERLTSEVINWIAWDGYSLEEKPFEKILSAAMRWAYADAARTLQEARMGGFLQIESRAEEQLDGF